MTMRNHTQFVRQTAAVLLAFGLITSLLPGFLAAQDLSTRESLDKDWEWVREEPQEWQWKDGVLRLRTQPGGVWGPTEPAKNVLVSKSAIKGKSSVEALIGLEDPVRKWEQAGLLVYGDDDHFVKLIVEFIDGKFYVVMAWELGKQSKVVAKVETGLQEAWLRYEVDGNKVRGLWRKHGDSQWTEAAVCEFPEDLKGRFAIFTQTGPEKEMRWATAKGVKVE
jgi:regulation of enolase protein 1 (concanavalin A-like superfamily)